MAAAIGVSESSLKRWADTGRVRVSRTMGGHRRIPIQEVIRFAREANLPIVKPEILGIEQSQIDEVADRIEESPSLVDTFTELLVTDQAEEARAVLTDLYFQGRSVAWLGDEMIRPAMQTIGEMWMQADEGILIEHRAVDICMQTLMQLRTLISGVESSGDATGPDSERPLALGGAPAGDPYVLSSLLVSCVLLESGFRVTNYGANVPIDALLEAVRQHRPRLVWLSCSHPESMPPPRKLDELADKIGALGGVLMIGGRASPNGSGGSEYLRRSGSLAELNAYASGLVGRG